MACDTYRSNKFTLVVVSLASVCVLGIVLVSVATSRGRGDLAFYVSGGAALVGILLLLAWLWSASVTVDPGGIRYRSLFGTQEMSWENVDRMYYSSIRQSINLIPVGTYYWFRLMDSRGHRIRFGNRIERPAEVGARLVEHTTQPILKRVAVLFGAGSEVDFGPIRVSRSDGIRIRKLLRSTRIGWDEVGSYEIRDGRFYVWRKGQKSTRGTAIRNIPNVFVLKALLDILRGAEE